MEIYQGKGGETKHIEKAYVTKQSYDKPSLLNSGENIISEIYEDNQGNIVRSYEGGIYTDMTYNMQGELTAKWTMGKSLSSDNGMLEIYVYNEKGDLTDTITEPGYKATAENTGYYIREDTEDEEGNIIPGSIVSESEYDEAGNAVSQTDPMGNRTGYTYDETGNLTSVTNPDGTKYSYEYDVIGEGGTTKDIVLEPRGTEAASAKSKSTVITDAADRVIRIEDTGTEENDSASIYTDYEYDIRDNLIKATEKKGNYKTYTYDSRDRVTAIEYYEKQNGQEVKSLKSVFTYDDADNMLSMSDYRISEGEESLYRYTAYEYDSMNRLTAVSECKIDEKTELTGGKPAEETIAEGRISYGYDGKDNLVSITYPKAEMGVKGLEFEYDRFNYLLNVKGIAEDDSKRLIREYTYDNFGRVSEMKDYTDFLSDKSKAINRSYSYDKYGRLTAIEYRDNLSGNRDSNMTSNLYGCSDKDTY